MRRWKLRLGLELTEVEEKKNGLYASRLMSVIKSLAHWKVGGTHLYGVMDVGNAICTLYDEWTLPHPSFESWSRDCGLPSRIQ